MNGCNIIHLIAKFSEHADIILSEVLKLKSERNNHSDIIIIGLPYSATLTDIMPEDILSRKDYLQERDKLVYNDMKLDYAFIHKQPDKQNYYPADKRGSSKKRRKPFIK